MTDTPATIAINLGLDTAELVASVLTDAADQRVRTARKASGLLREEAAAQPGKDRRTAAVKITDLLAEADLLEQVAQAARTTEPTPPAAPPPKARRTTRKAAKSAPVRPDGTRDPDAGPTAADAAIALAAIEEFNATEPPLPDPDGTAGDLLDSDDADLDPAETGAAAEDDLDPDLDNDELDVIGLSDPDDVLDPDVDDDDEVGVGELDSAGGE